MCEAGGGVGLVIGLLVFGVMSTYTAEQGGKRRVDRKQQTN